MNNRVTQLAGKGILVLASTFVLPLAALADILPTGGGNQPSPPPAVPADVVVLYDQYDNAGTNATSSQNFEAANNAYDDFLADDFVVPASDSWRIDLIEVDGVYYGGPGPAQSVNVWIYNNGNGGVPDVPVGQPVCQFLNLAYAPGPAAGDFVIPIPNPCCLLAGHYWLVIQVNQDYTPYGQWGWTDRTVTSNVAASWQNPGGGFAVCPTWNRRAAGCLIDPAAPDQVFRLSGTRPCEVVPVASSTWGAIKAIYP